MTLAKLKALVINLCGPRSKFLQHAPVCDQSVSAKARDGLAVFAGTIAS
jgi:hypothetical protein